MTFAHAAMATGGLAVFAQVAGAAGGDPTQALWSLVGSSPVAGVMYLWVRSAEKRAREAESSERTLTKKLLDVLTADAAWKAEIRHALKSAAGGGP